jgi:general secretion pathway protein D
MRSPSHVVSHKQLGITQRPSARLAALCACLLPLFSYSQVVGQRDTTERATFSLSGQVELPRLVDLTAQRLGVPIEYDSGTLRGTVTLRQEGGLSNEQLWEQMNQMLAARGFTTVRGPGSASYSVVPLPSAAAAAGVWRGPGREAPTGPTPGFIGEMVECRHRGPKELAEAVKLVLSKPTGGATPVGDTNLLLITDLTPRIEEAKRLLAVLDTPTGGAAVEEVKANFLTGTQLATLVKQVAGKRDEVSGQKLSGEVLASPNGDAVLIVASPANVPAWRALVSQLDRREAVSTVTYTPRMFAASDVSSLIEESVRGSAVGGAGGDDRWRLVTDELTSSLIITATPSQHEQIAAIMDRLDSQQMMGVRPVRSFPIRNRPADELLDTLNSLVDAGALEGAWSDEDSTTTRNAGAQQSSFSRDGVARVSTGGLPGGIPVSGQASPSTLTSAAPGAPSVAFPLVPGDGAAQRNNSRSALSMTVDKGTNTLIAIGESRVLAQLEALVRTLDVRQPQVLLEVTLVSLSDSDTMSLGVELEKLFSDGDTRYRVSSLFGLAGGTAGSRTVGDGAGFTGAMLNPGDFAAVVRAVENVSEGRSVSVPRVLVNNNEQATFGSVLQQPVGTLERTDSTLTSGFAGTQDAGTTISVKPQIAEGDHLVLDYSVSLSSFVGNSPGAGLPPPRQQNKVDSVATIPDGHVVVVGGLELTTDAENAQQLPLLGNIPLIGNLFKNQSSSAGRQRFYVFIKPTILRQERFEDLKYLSARERKEAGVIDGLPAVEPRIIR